MSGDTPAAHFRQRRQMLLGTAAALLSGATRLACTGRGKAAAGRRPSRHLQPDASRRVRGIRSRLQRRQGRGAAFRIQQIQRLARDQGVADGGRLKAAYMLAPLIMDLADSSIPVKVVSLGHRSGAVIMVRTDSPYKRFKDLKGKRVAIPSRFAVDYLFLRQDAGQGGHDGQGPRSHGDGAARHAGRALRESRGWLRDRRAFRRGCAARRLRAAASA